MLRILVVIVGWLVAVPAYAYPVPGSSMASNSGGGCSATLVMNITLRGKSAADVQEQFESRMNKLSEFIKEQKIDRFALQTMNYSINAQQNPYGSNMYGYMQDPAGAQLTSNATYMVESAQNAFRLAQFLTQLQFIVNVNANRLSNAPCASASDQTDTSTAPTPPPAPDAPATAKPDPSSQTPVKK